MHKKIAKITGTFLGIERDVLTATLFVDYGGSCQGIGQFAFDEYDPKTKERHGHAVGTEWIRRALLACSVESWENLKGRTIYVFFDDDDWNATPRGIGPLPTEKGTDFFFQALSDEYFPKKAT